MAQRDREIVKKVTDEWYRGAGGSLTVVGILETLQRLQTRHGDDFSIEKACDALESLASDAKLIKDNIVEASNALQV